MLLTSPDSWDIATSTFSPEVRIDPFLLGSQDLLGPYQESKYSHAAVWGIRPGYTTADGKRSYPLTAMVANLAKSTPDKPALMLHADVVTFFHEMGHVFHGWFV